MLKRALVGSVIAMAGWAGYTQARRWAESTHRDAPYTALLP